MVQCISILGIAISPVPSPTLYLVEDLGVPPFLHCFTLGTQHPHRASSWEADGCAGSCSFSGKLQEELVCSPPALADPLVPVCSEIP